MKIDKKRREEKKLQKNKKEKKKDYLLSNLGSSKTMPRFRFCRTKERVE
jgi:hypothetical protein